MHSFTRYYFQIESIRKIIEDERWERVKQEEEEERKERDQKVVNSKTDVKNENDSNQNKKQMDVASAATQLVQEQSKEVNAATTPVSLTKATATGMQAILFRLL